MASKGLAAAIALGLLAIPVLARPGSGGRVGVPAGQNDTRYDTNMAMDLNAADAAYADTNMSVGLDANHVESDPFGAGCAPDDGVCRRAEKDIRNAVRDIENAVRALEAENAADDPPENMSGPEARP